MSETTKVKTNWFKSALAKIKPLGKQLDNVSEDTRDAGNTLAFNFANSFQEFITFLVFTTFGALMIFYIGGYPGGVERLLAELMLTLLPGVPFTQAWLALWIGLYLLFSFFIVFSVMILRTSFEDPHEITLDQIDELREDVLDLIQTRDGLLQSMQALTDKIDELKLHL